MGLAIDQYCASACRCHSKSCLVRRPFGKASTRPMRLRIGDSLSLLAVIVAVSLYSWWLDLGPILFAPSRSDAWSTQHKTKRRAIPAILGWRNHAMWSVMDITRLCPLWRPLQTVTRRSCSEAFPFTNPAGNVLSTCADRSWFEACCFTNPFWKVLFGYLSCVVALTCTTPLRTSLITVECAWNELMQIWCCNEAALKRLLAGWAQTGQLLWGDRWELWPSSLKPQMHLYLRGPPWHHRPEHIQKQQTSSEVTEQTPKEPPCT